MAGLVLLWPRHQSGVTRKQAFHDMSALDPLLEGWREFGKQGGWQREDGAHVSALGKNGLSKSVLRYRLR